MDIAFVGRVMKERPLARGAGRTYEFVVDQKVKGPVGREIDVNATTPLVDATNKPIIHDEAVGVVANLDGARFVTESCMLSDPGTLLAVSDEQKGNRIRLVIGIVILVAVLAYCVRRLRARNRAELERSTLPR